MLSLSQNNFDQVHVTFEGLDEHKDVIAERDTVPKEACGPVFLRGDGNDEGNDWEEQSSCHGAANVD